MASNNPPLLALEDVSRLTTLSRRAIYRARQSGDFPQPVRLPTTGTDKPRIAWRSADVQAWIDSLQPAREKAK